MLQFISKTKTSHTLKNTWISSTRERDSIKPLSHEYARISASVYRPCLHHTALLSHTVEIKREGSLQGQLPLGSCNGWGYRQALLHLIAVSIGILRLCFINLLFNNTKRRRQKKLFYTAKCLHYSILQKFNFPSKRNSSSFHSNDSIIKS